VSVRVQPSPSLQLVPFVTVENDVLLFDPSLAGTAAAASCRP